MSATFSYLVTCLDCGFSEDLRSPTTLVRGWAKQYRHSADGRSVVEEGDICDICFARQKAMAEKAA